MNGANFLMTDKSDQEQFLAPGPAAVVPEGLSRDLADPGPIEPRAAARGFANCRRLMGAFEVPLHLSQAKAN